MSKITKINAREILDSRGNPTLEVDTILEGGMMGRFSVPSGASTGKYEALEKRDADPEHFAGKGVAKLAKKIENDISKEFIGKDFDQRSLDDYLIEKDGTENKSNFGANTTLGISMSFAKAEALRKNIPFHSYIATLLGNNFPTLPIPMVNIINGGAHADNDLDIQEFMIVPLQRYGTFRKVLENCNEIFMCLKDVLLENNLSIAVGDEGGFAPKIPSHKDALDLIMQAIQKAGFSPGVDFGIALDVAASELYSNSSEDSVEAHKNGKYVLKSENKEMTGDELSDYYEGLIKNYPIISVEDPFAEDDWEASINFTAKFGENIMIVGDDLIVTNMKRLIESIEKKAANTILVKLNQIGTLSETLDVVKKAKESSWTTIISHRSGETEDTAVSHLAVGVSSKYIKTGSLSRGERIAKYNELLRIEEDILNDRS